jgi:hypothetical protein
MPIRHFGTIASSIADVFAPSATTNLAEIGFDRQLSHAREEASLGPGAAALLVLHFGGRYCWRCDLVPLAVQPAISHDRYRPARAGACLGHVPFLNWLTRFSATASAEGGREHSVDICTVLATITPALWQPDPRRRARSHRRARQESVHALSRTAALPVRARQPAVRRRGAASPY